MRAILGRRRGENRQFYREIPGFLGGVWARHGDSAHGGHGRANLAKKFLKKGVENRKLGAREVPEGGAGAHYIGRAGRLLGTIFRSGG